MRYDTPIHFLVRDPGKYNASTGNYDEGVFRKTMMYASVYNSSVETLSLVYGEIRQGSYTIQLQNHYTELFDHIQIADKRYKVDHSQTLRSKQTFVVSEVL